MAEPDGNSREAEVLAALLEGLTADIRAATVELQQRLLWMRLARLAAQRRTFPGRWWCAEQPEACGARLGRTGA